MVKPKKSLQLFQDGGKTFHFAMEMKENLIKETPEYKMEVEGDCGTITSDNHAALWHGRFQEGPDAQAVAFETSILSAKVFCASLLFFIM